MVVPRGHSLVELMVALTLLGISLAAISATTVLSVRRTQDAVHFQEATALGLALLDSLLADPDPRSGTGPGEWGAIHWEVRDTVVGRLVSVRVGARRDHRTVAEFGGLWIPTPPPFPGTAP